MERAEQIRVIEGLIKHLDEGTNVDAGHQLQNPVSSYTCPDIARQEWQHFFQDYPHVLGLSVDLPGPRSFLTSNAIREGAGCPD